MALKVMIVVPLEPTTFASPATNFEDTSCTKA
jgi:hypothetical protein